MGYVLDTLLIKELIAGPVTVNADFDTDSIDISNREDEFSVQLNYDGGVGVDMDLELQVSNDNVNFVTIGTQNVTDATGTHVWDVIGTGTAYARVHITVNAGSMDVQNIIYKAKRRH